MKILVPVDASEAALAPISYLESLARSGVQLEVVVMNVQPRFHRHVARGAAGEARDVAVKAGLHVQDQHFELHARAGERLEVFDRRQRRDGCVDGNENLHCRTSLVALRLRSQARPSTPPVTTMNTSDFTPGRASSHSW